MYAQIAAVALPYVLSAMQRRPDMPQYQPTAQLADRSQYIDQILNAGFNPNADIYKQASNVVADRVSREMGRQGLGGSSFASGAMSSALTDLANKYLENELQRKTQALSTATNYDMNQANFQRGLDESMYNAQMAGYQDRMQRQNAATQGMAGLAQAGLGIYQQQQLMDQRQQNFDRMMNTPYSYRNTFNYGG